MKKNLQKRKGLKNSLLLLGVWLISFSTYALDFNVKGKVTDENGDGLPGVSVAIKGTSRGTSTDPSGITPFRFQMGIQSLFFQVLDTTKPKK